MGRKIENTNFICENCGFDVKSLSNGSYRNHCPRCLYSKHLDIVPGDRINTCKGLMEPVGINQHKTKGFQIIHKCLDCNELKHNRIAEYDDEPDNFDLIITLM